jgi:hypothetical protein
VLLVFGAPCQLLLLAGREHGRTSAARLGASRPYAMFKDYWKYEWVLPVYRYEGLEPLLATLAEKVIAPAEGKVKALEERRRMIEAELTKPQ